MNSYNISETNRTGYEIIKRRCTNTWKLLNFY